MAFNGLHHSVSSAILTQRPKFLSEVNNFANQLTNVRHTAPVASSSNSFTNSVYISTEAVAQLTTVMTKQQQQHPLCRNYSSHHANHQQYANLSSFRKGKHVHVLEVYALLIYIFKSNMQQ
jgi:hypothetical protein